MKKNMKFISKSSNYCIILKPGISAEPITGRAAVPGVSVKFENGIAIINDENMCQLLMANPAFNVDFILADDLSHDPFLRSSTIDPKHDLIDVNYGHPGKKGGDADIRNEQLIKMAKVMAIEMTKELAPKLAKEIIADLALKQEKDKKSKKEEKDEDKSSEKEIKS